MTTRRFAAVCLGTLLAVLMFAPGALAKKKKLPMLELPKDAKVSELVDVFGGEGQLQIHMVRVLPKDSELYIILVEGTDDDIAGHPLLHKHRTESRDEIYQTITKGDEHWTLQMVSSYGSPAWRAILLDNYKPISVAKLSKPGKYKGADLLEMYKKQLADGTIKKISE